MADPNPRPCLRLTGPSGVLREVCVTTLSTDSWLHSQHGLMNQTFAMQTYSDTAAPSLVAILQQQRSCVGAVGHQLFTTESTHSQSLSQSPKPNLSYKQWNQHKAFIHNLISSRLVNWKQPFLSFVVILTLDQHTNTWKCMVDFFFAWKKHFVSLLRIFW